MIKQGFARVTTLEFPGLDLPAEDEVGGGSYIGGIGKRLNEHHDAYLEVSKYVLTDVVVL